MARSRPAVDTARRMKMANLIRQKRLEAGLDQIGLAKRLGVTPAAVGNWERCLARPDFDTIPGLCGALGISVTELMDLPPELCLNGDERDVLAAYRGMAPADRHTVRAFIAGLEQSAQEQRYESLRQSACPMPVVLSAAAGFGAVMDGELPTEQLYVRSNPCQRRSTVLVKVNGQSMEPRYEDGSFVYVDQHRAPRVGDDVVVVFEGIMYIKRFTPRGLESCNPDYPLIRVDGWEDVHCVGVVTGRVNDYDILSGRELREVEQAYAANEA